jgi:hypothetical protein
VVRGDPARRDRDLVVLLLRLDSFALHAVITTLVAAPIALILYFIAVTDRPFQGGVSVSPEPYRIVLETIMIPEMKRGK